MKNTVFLLENDKGKKNWIEVSDQSFWGNPSVGDWIFVGRKQWQVKAILNEQAAAGTATLTFESDFLPSAQNDFFELTSDNAILITSLKK